MRVLDALALEPGARGHEIGLRVDAQQGEEPIDPDRPDRDTDAGHESQAVSAGSSCPASLSEPALTSSKCRS